MMQNLEIASLKEKLGLLGVSTRGQKADIEESERHLQISQEDASDIVKKVELLG